MVNGNLSLVHIELHAQSGSCFSLSIHCGVIGAVMSLHPTPYSTMLCSMEHNPLVTFAVFISL